MTARKSCAFCMVRVTCDVHCRTLERYRRMTSRRRGLRQSVRHQPRRGFGDIASAPAGSVLTEDVDLVKAGPAVAKGPDRFPWRRRGHLASPTLPTVTDAADRYRRAGRRRAAAAAAAAGQRIGRGRARIDGRDPEVPEMADRLFTSGSKAE